MPMLQLHRARSHFLHHWLTNQHRFSGVSFYFLVDSPLRLEKYFYGMLINSMETIFWLSRTSFGSNFSGGAVTDEANFFRFLQAPSAEYFQMLQPFGRRNLIKQVLRVYVYILTQPFLILLSQNTFLVVVKISCLTRLACLSKKENPCPIRRARLAIPRWQGVRQAHLVPCGADLLLRSPDIHACLNGH